MYPCIEASYFTPSDLAQSFIAICTNYRYRLIQRTITYMHGWLSPHGKGSSRLLGGLHYEKIHRHNNSPPYVMTRWLLQQIPPLNSMVLVHCGTRFLLTGLVLSTFLVWKSDANCTGCQWDVKVTRWRLRALLLRLSCCLVHSKIQRIASS